MYSGYGYPGYGGCSGYGLYSGYYGYPGYASGYSYNPYAYGINPYGTAVVGTAATSLPAIATVAEATPVTTTQDPASTAATFSDKGEASFKSGDYAGAAYSWKHAIVDNSDNPVLGLMLGQALFATGKYEESAGMTQAALNQLPKDKWGVVVQNSRELYGNYQDYTSQLRALEGAARARTNDPALRFLLGYHYAYLGYPQQAVDQLDKVLSLAPGDEIAKQLRDEMKTKLPKVDAPNLPPAQLLPLPSLKN
jgi:tetratricopeptide (TPR) repeat protein